jgi:hypothetical protein
LAAAEANRGDDTKNVDDGRSSRAAEDVGHSPTKGGVEGRGNKAAETTTSKSWKKYQGTNEKAKQERKTEVRSSKAAKDDGEARE